MLNDLNHLDFFIFSELLAVQPENVAADWACDRPQYIGNVAEVGHLEGNKHYHQKESCKTHRR